MREKGIDKYANVQTTLCTQYANKNEVELQFSRKRELCWTIKGQDKEDDE